MLVVQHYLYLPGCCAFCRSSNLPTIDTQLDLDGHNSPDDPNPSAVQRMYICADCAVNLATMVIADRGQKIVTEIWFQEMQSNLENLSRSNLEKQREIDDLRQALTVVRTVNEYHRQQSEPVEQPVATPEPPSPEKKKSSFKVVTSPDKKVL
jgi:hypothetical protein